MHEVGEHLLAMDQEHAWHLTRVGLHLADPVTATHAGLEAAPQHFPAGQRAQSAASQAEGAVEALLRVGVAWKAVEFRACEPLRRLRFLA
jgi:hypothetical protein